VPGKVLFGLNKGFGRGFEAAREGGLASQSTSCVQDTLAQKAVESKICRAVIGLMMPRMLCVHQIP
jgi:hypothetical protein